MEKQITYACPTCGTIGQAQVSHNSRRYLTDCTGCGKKLRVKIPGDVRHEYHALEADIQMRHTVTCPKCGTVEAIPQMAEEIIKADGKYPIKGYQYECKGCGLKIKARVRDVAKTPVN